jgi:hypothetical protein
MSFPAVFTFDPRLTGHDQGSVAEVRVENQRSCIPEGPGLRSGQADCARVRLEWKKSSSPSMRMAGRASPAAQWVKERQQWLGRVRGPDRRQTVGQSW